MQKFGAQDLQWTDLPAAEPYSRLAGQIGVPASECTIEVGIGDPAVPVQSAERRLPQSPRHAIEVTGPADRLFERHSLKSGQWVHRYEGLQWIVRRHHPGGQGDVSAQPGTASVEIGGVEIGGGNHERTPVSRAGEDVRDVARCPALSACA